jgi:hypothetical protein
MVIFLILLIINKQYKEHYYDITPYEYHWNIFKCYDSDCARKRNYECYKYCDNIINNRGGAADYCRLMCGDYTDLQYDHLKFNNYNWNSLLPKFSKYSLLNEKIENDIF